MRLTPDSPRHKAEAAVADSLGGLRPKPRVQGAQYARRRFADVHTPLASEHIPAVTTAGSGRITARQPACQPIQHIVDAARRWSLHSRFGMNMRRTGIAGAHASARPAVTAWLLTGVVLLSVTVAGAHSVSHEEDDHPCPVCLHTYTLNWTPDAPPLPKPLHWQPLIPAPVAEVFAAPLVATRSRGPPFTLL